MSNQHEGRGAVRRSVRIYGDKVQGASTSDFHPSASENVTAEDFAALQKEVSRLAESDALKTEQISRLQRESAELLEQLRAERVASSQAASTSSPSPAVEATCPGSLSEYERQQRVKYAKCLIIRRLDWEAKETPRSLQRKVSLLSPFLKVSDEKIVSAQRIGPLSMKRLPQLVLVEMADVQSKMEVLQHSHRLAISRKGSESHISLDHALTVEQRNIRAAQWPLIQEAKAKGIRWFWSHVAPHKLIVPGMRVHGHGMTS